jgi:hypothetical protein
LVSPLVEVNSASLGAWTSTENGVNVALGETISVRLADSAGVRFWVLSVIGTDEVVLAPTITQASVVSGVATFTAPATPTDGWAVIIRSQVGIRGLELDNNNAIQTGYTSSFGVYTPTAINGRVGATNETSEGSAAFGWVPKLNAVAKAPPGAGGPPTGAATGDWSGTFPSGTNKRVNNQYVPWKSTVRAATTANITLSGSQAVDGVTLTNGVDRVLVTAQTTASQNGIYLYNSGGAWTRASDMATSQDTLPGSRVHIYDGNTWANTEWTLTTQGSLSLGSTSLQFTPGRTPTVAALRLVAGKVTGETIEVPCFASHGDGGGGTFVWKVGTQPTDDKGVNIVPSVTTAGWWQRRYSGPVSVKWFGAKGDGTTDDAPAIQDALTYFSSNLLSGRIIFPSVGNLGQSLYYNLASKITVQGSLGHSIWLDGEYTSPNGVGGAKLSFSGASGTKGMIDLLGANDVRITNFDIIGNSLPKYVVWFHPDQAASPQPLGASKLLIDNVNIRYPQNVAGACALGFGPDAGEPVNQSDNITVSNSRIQGTGGAGYNPVGIKNLSGGNAKLAKFDNVNIGGFKYAYDFANTSGPITIIAGGVSDCVTAAIYASSVQLEILGWDCETNLGDCKIVTGSFGGGNGTIHFQGCELEYQDGPGTGHGTATNDIAIDWPGGMLSFEQCGIINSRSVAISGATAATPIVLTVPSGHAIVAGDRIQISGVVGMTGVNTADYSFSQVTSVTSTTLTVTGTGTGAYVSGGTIHLEPKILIETNTLGAGNPMSGVFSVGNTWLHCGSNLPIFDRSTGLRLLDSTNAQAKPWAIHSFNDVGFQEGRSTPHALPTTLGRSLRFASLAAGVLQVDSTGTVFSASAPIPDATSSVKGIIKLAQDIAGSAALPTVVGLTGTTGTVAMHGTKVLWDTNGPSVETSSGDLVLRVNTAGKNVSIFDTTNRIFDLNYNSGNAYFQLPSNISSLGVFANTAGGQYLRFQASTMYLDADLNIRSISSTQRMSVTSGGVTMDSLAGTGSRIVLASAAGLLSALTAGSNGQVFAMVSGSPAWSTPGGDVTGAPSASTVVQLTGATNSVAIPSGTHLDWASGPTIAKGGASSSGLQLKVNAASEALSFYESSNRAWSTAWNSGNPYIQLGSTATSLQITADTGTSQSMRLLVAGTTPVGLQLAADTIDFLQGSTTAKGRYTNTGFRIGDATNPTHTLEVAGQMGIDGQIVWSSASTAAVLNAKTNTAIVFMIAGTNMAEIDPTGVVVISDVISGPASNPSVGIDLYSEAGRPTWRGSASGSKKVSWESNVAATAGIGGATLPAAPAEFLTLFVDGNARKIPLYPAF